MAEPRRVALLARPGEACERLRAALREAGAEIVLEADPASLEAAALSAAAPQAVLVALDPAVEDALDRFEDVLGDPSVAVIYDEADLAAKREGWDAARWVRHLSAKLNQHGDVLPPGRDPDEELQPRPGRPITPEQRHAGAQLTPFADEAEANAASVPSDPLPGLEAAPIALSLTDDIDEMSPSSADADAIAANATSEPLPESEAAPIGLSLTDDVDQMSPSSGEEARRQRPIPARHRRSGTAHRFDGAGRRTRCRRA